MVQLNIADHVGLAFQAARRAARGWGLEHEISDVVQECLVTMCSAGSRYDPERGAPSTFLTPWARAGAGRYCRRPLVRLEPRNSVSPQSRRRVVSLDIPVDGEGGELASRIDMTAGEELDVDGAIDARRVVARLLDVLEPRERHVITRRFGLDGAPCETLASLGRRLGVSRERIRQLEAEALERLRGAMEEENP